MAETSRPPGTAPIKKEFLLSNLPDQPLPDDDVAEGSTARTRALNESDMSQASTGPSRKKWTKEQKKEKRGANKGRRFGKIRDELELCWRVAIGKTCEFGSECRFTHDIPEYMKAKPTDIHFSPTADLSNAAPYVAASKSVIDEQFDTLDLSTTCPIFAETGFCRFGLKCRFLGGHVRKERDGHLTLVEDEEKKAQAAVSTGEVNFIDADALKRLRSKKYIFAVTDEYLKELQSNLDKERDGTSVLTSSETKEAAPNPSPCDIISHPDAQEARVRFSEKKRLLWTGKTYLAPLTTVGNLPFRRLCVTYGADITCGEMGLANSFLSGSKEEWSLVRRHPSESIFGVQVAGSKPANLVPTAEVLAKELGGNIDFVDVNCGCPIDLVFKTGSGSALLDAPGKLAKIVDGMNRALGEIPVTIKLRTGVKDGRNNAHKIMPRFASDVGCITLHGRTRQQRYTKLADWDYIKQCVEAVRAREAEEGLPPVPIFGGGDCFSSEDYWSDVEFSGVSGVMVGRGALIKPWIFTEIKERREWDISSRERLDGIRRYAEYGLNHFGSDTAGVNTTRRYLCEALSFQYRYIPIGLLERLPGRLNDRPPAFRGRDDLETLLASGDSRDWVRISEMFLGPAPESWSFTPKHKSNAYENEAQG